MELSSRRRRRRKRQPPGSRSGRISPPVQPAPHRGPDRPQPDHADGARQALRLQRRRFGAQRRLPGRACEGGRRPPDHRQPCRPPHVDDRVSARRLGVSARGARGRPPPDRRRPRSRRGDLRAAEPLRPQRLERLGGRPPRPLGPVGGEVSGLRRDAEGHGARGHQSCRRMVGTVGRAVARGRLRRHRGAHLAQLPAAPVPLAPLQTSVRTSTAARSRTGCASRGR